MMTTRTDQRLATAAASSDDRCVAERCPCERGSVAATASLPDALTWSATVDPHDDTREIEITDEMVSLAIASMEGEQVYPFRREAGAAPPVARPVRKADVIEFRRR